MAMVNLSSSYLPMGQVGNYRPQTRRPFQPGRPVSVGEWKQNFERNPMARYADGSAVPVGTKINMPTWSGARGMNQGGRIGSAAGALGSSGVPTSMRGRAEKYGMDPFTGEGAWQMPSWMVAQQQRDEFGLSPDWAYGNMGLNPYNSASPVGSTPGASPKPADSSTSTKPDPWGDRTTYGNRMSVPPMKSLAGPAISAVGGMLGIPGSFFGTSVMDMLNRQKLW